MHSKELYKLPVVWGIIYGIKKYECLEKNIILHYKNYEMKEMNYIYTWKEMKEIIYRIEMKQIVNIKINGIYLHSYLVLTLHWEKEMRWKHKWEDNH